MLRVNIPVDLSVLRSTRETVIRSPGLMGLYTEQIIQPNLQQRVDQTFAVYPPPVSTPFKFGTARSRRWYFANVKSGAISSDGEHYIRSEELKKAWRVLIDRRQNEGYLAVRNIADTATYVFGIRQVAGHQITGWGANFPSATIEVGGLATYLLAQGWFLITSQRWGG